MVRRPERVRAAIPAPSGCYGTPEMNSMNLFKIFFPF